MPKKNKKKSQKQVESAPPRDNDPAPPVQGPVPAVPEDSSKAAVTPATESAPVELPTTEEASSEIKSEEQGQSIPPTSEVENNEATTAESLGAGPTSAPSADPEPLQPSPDETEQSLAEAVPTSEQEHSHLQHDGSAQPIDTVKTEPSVDRMIVHNPDEAPKDVPEPEAPSVESTIEESQNGAPGPEAPSDEGNTGSQSQPELINKVDNDAATEPLAIALPTETADDSVKPQSAPGSPKVSAVAAAEVVSLPMNPEEAALEDLPVENGLPVSETVPPPAPEASSAPADIPVAEAVPEEAQARPKKETTKQRRARLAREIDEEDEQEKLEAERLKQASIQQEELDRAQREKDAEEQRQREDQKAIEAAAQKEVDEEKERQRIESERLETERLAHEQSEKQRLEDEEAEQARLALEKLDQERLDNEAREASEAAKQESIEAEIRDAQVAAEQERKDREALELEEAAKQERLENEARKAAEVAEQAQLEAKEAETVRIAAEEALREQTSTPAQREVLPPAEEIIFEPVQPSPTGEIEMPEVPEVPQVTREALVDKETALEPPAESARTLSPEPMVRVPERSASTTAPSRGPSSPQAYTAAAPAVSLPQDRLNHAHVDGTSNSAHSSGSEATRSKKRTAAPPKPQAVAQLIEDNRPPAPSPPTGRVQPRHASALDSEDESDTALVQTRRPFRGGESRDTSHGSTYPPQLPTNARGPFASRVPVEPTYSEPPPPPPGYHPRYYAQAAPPYYQNHGHAMTQRGYSAPNPLYGPPPHSSSSPYQESWNQYPPGYPPYGSPPQRQDSSGSRDYPLHAIENGAAVEDDSADIFARIASIAHAIPDLQVLLAQYKETHTQLRVREELLRRASVEQEEKIRAKNHEIDDLRDRARHLDDKYSADSSRLRFHVHSLEEQSRELREQVAVAEKYKKEAEDTKAVLEAEMKSWEAKYKELEDAHMLLERTAADEKAKAWKAFDDWKSSATTKHDAEKIALAIQFDKKLKEADILAENQRREAAAAFVKEKDELRSEHQRQQREREASFDRARNELEAKLGAAQRDREDALKQERESREFWFSERETLTKAHQEDHESLKRGWIDQRELLEAQHKKTREESDKAWIELHADATKKAEEEKARADELIQEKEELLKQFNALKAESSKEKDVIKTVVTNLESERTRLEKLMECYGDIAEIKSKGDTYYLVSFSQLQKQIIDLASTHFVHLPVRPPPEDLALVPSNLPSFLGDTPASRQVRAAYIAHTVSKLITYRVFGPFLFSLGRRYDKADSLFLSMSNHIRDKSTRKEAIWRQQTLLAAFTSSGAKQRINTAAGTVVEEIVNAIKHFADPKEEEGIKIAVKRIVKLAAETWRFARLEREMITATMPALEDEEHQFTGPEYWPTYKPDGTLIASLVGTAPPSDERPQLLLRLFPVIYRELKHENFQGDGEERDEGCVFHHGLALYDDADAVVTRTEELRSAGLPSHTIVSTSPTAEHGKFPPLHDICPPPRDPPPSPPAPPPSDHKTTERASVRSASISASMSPPLSPTSKSEKASIRQAKTPTPSPSSVHSLEESTQSKPVAAYQRPPPGPIDFASPRNLIGLVPPVESTFSSNPSTSAKVPVATTENPVESVSQASAPASQAPARSTVESASQVSSPPSHVPTEAPTNEGEPAITPAESAIIPASFSNSTRQENGSRDLPTPPHSPSSASKRPVSPLFEAVDEIEALQSHRSRPSTASSRRRSTHTKRPTEEDLPEVNPRSETVRRTSGYALSTRTSKTADSERSERTEKSDRTERTEKSEKSGRDPKSKYMCESRSAAVKALYPNGPLAIPNGSLKGSSVKSEKKKDRDSRDSTRESTKDSHRGSKELKREKSIPDNGTWDTNSMSRASFEANTQLSD